MLSDGKLVFFVEIEIEYFNYDIDESKFGFEFGVYVEFFYFFYGNLSLCVGFNGEFFVVLLWVGWWGICVLDVGLVKMYEGKLFF